MVSPVESIEARRPPSATVALLRDGIIVIAITLGCAAVAIHMELNERIFSLTREHEALQVDELPLVLLVFSLGLMWISWRRTRELAIQLRARDAAEARLADALRVNREFGQRQLQAVDAERRHLAREIHDELGQYLNAIKIDAVALRQTANAGEPASLAACERIVAVCDHVHSVVGDLIRRLRPAGLDDLGLTAALENCVDHWRARLPQTELKLNVSGKLDELDDTVSLTVYRLVQEGLTNCFKHADANRIDVTVERQSMMDQFRDMLVVRVHDDGMGVTTPSPSGFGLAGLRERVQMMGGTFGVDLDRESGFGFLAHLPLTTSTARSS